LLAAIRAEEQRRVVKALRDKLAPTGAELVSQPPEPDETARERVAMLAGRAKRDEREALERRLAAEYGGNRRAKRRARVEAKRAMRPKKRLR
jgi:hypothetical protein